MSPFAWHVVQALLVLAATVSYARPTKRLIAAGPRAGSFVSRAPSPHSVAIFGVTLAIVAVAFDYLVHIFRHHV